MVFGKVQFSNTSLVSRQACMMVANSRATDRPTSLKCIQAAGPWRADGGRRIILDFVLTLFFFFLLLS